MRSLSWFTLVFIGLWATGESRLVGSQMSMIVLDNRITNATLQSYAGAKVILGTLQIQSSFCTNSAFAAGTHLTALDAAFSQVNEIRGGFSFDANICIPNLSFLRNLVVIRGLGVNTYANLTGDSLFIRDNNGSMSNVNILTAFRLDRLQVVQRGDIVITGAPNSGNPPVGLCGKGSTFYGFDGADLSLLMPGTTINDTTAIGPRTLIRQQNGVNYTLVYTQDQPRTLTPLDSLCTLPFCHSTCNGRCWSRNDPATCQKVCNSTCGLSGCRDNNMNQCCSSNCLGGCDANGVCYACADGLFRNPDGTCTAACSNGLFPYGYYIDNYPGCANESTTTVRAISRIYSNMDCVASCPSDTALFNNTCVFVCPGAVAPVNGVCPTPTAEDLKYVVCNGISGTLSGKCQLKIVEEQNCDTIAGSFFVTSLSSIAQSTMEEMNVLRKIKRITGFVYVFQTSFSSMSFFENLERIDGQELTSNYTVLVTYNNQMKNMGWKSLRRVGSTRFFVKDQLQMCLHDTVNWNRLAGTNTTALYTFTQTWFTQTQSQGLLNGFNWLNDFNGKTSHPTTCAEARCHEFCGGSCWGPGIDQCQRCPTGQLLRSGTCVVNCTEGGVEGFYTDSWACFPCHASCKTCTGPDTKQCLTCAPGLVYRTDGSCTDFCNHVDGYYALNGICVFRTQCGTRKFPNLITARCDDCDSSCAECTTTSTQCTKCTGELFLMGTQCKAQCDQGFYKNFTDNTCRKCHINCAVCTGPTQDECVSCQLGSFLIFNTSTCLYASCPSAYYGNFDTSTCDPCSQNCNRCVPFEGQVPCSQCSNAAYLDYITQTCTFDCPENNYGDGTGSLGRRCRPCRNCLASEWESQICSTQSNRICNPCLQCDTTKNWVAAPCARFSNTDCRPISVCDLRTQFIESRATPTSDTVCKPLTVCDPVLDFEKVPATNTSDRVCQRLTVCQFKFSFESTAPTRTSDRVCTPVKVCDKKTEFLFTPATLFADNVCRTCRSCNGTYEIPKGGCNGVDNTICEPIDRCFSSPCLNGATCNINGGLFYSCKCRTNFIGVNCEIDTRVCTPEPCLNGGLCVPKANLAYQCECPEPYGGDNCEIDLSVCDPNPCKANGTCTASVTGFSCKCLPGHTGLTCQIDASSCIGNQCSNGVCIAELGSAYRCECDEGWCGTFCDSEVVDNVCSVTEASTQNSMASVGAGVGVGLFVLLCVVLLFVYIRRNRVDPELYKQVQALAEKRRRRMPDEWEIERERLTIGKTIGEGAFGSVSKALYQDRNKGPMEPAVDVAVKMLKPSAAGTMDEDEFFAEMKLMKEIGRHRNVVSLVGVCTLDDPVFLVVEFADHGDLLHYLREHRATSMRPATLHFEDMLDFAIQVCCGMEYLASMKIVHRDLAARNVLVCANRILKVSDFGLARDIYEEDFYQKTTSGKMPFKWMAPESLHDRIFTTKSDVWSFGILMWEITTLGGAPYPTIQNANILEMLKSGHRMAKPEACSDEFYTIMRKCWEMFPEQRPTFLDVRDQLILAAGADINLYLDPNAGARPKEGAFAHIYGDVEDGPLGSYEEPGLSSYANGGVMERKGSLRTTESLGSFKATVLRNADEEAGAIYDNQMPTGNGTLPSSPDDYQKFKRNNSKKIGAPPFEVVSGFGPEDTEHVYDMGTSIDFTPTKMFPARLAGPSAAEDNGAVYDLASSEKSFAPARLQKPQIVQGDGPAYDIGNADSFLPARLQKKPVEEDVGPTYDNEVPGADEAVEETAFGNSGPSSREATLPRESIQYVELSATGTLLKSPSKRNF